MIVLADPDMRPRLGGRIRSDYLEHYDLRARQAVFAGIVGGRIRHSNAPRLAAFSLMRSMRAEPDQLDIVRSVRDARFASGLACVHCGDRAVVRWGAFATRQRYRCKGCGRTFSDLTRTAFAYTKKISSWPHYLVLMRRGLTLRRSAEQLNIHVSTAFRWRHALLSVVRVVDATTLSGTVELKEISFAHSLKGCRSVLSPRARGARYVGWTWHETSRDRVLLAVARNGAAHSATIGGDMVVTQRAADWARARLTDQCIVIGRMPKAGPCASPIRARGHDYQMLKTITDTGPFTICHTRNVDAFSRRLLIWLHRFRGVASKYRDNYLLWHRIADRDCDPLWARNVVVGSLPGVTREVGIGHADSICRPP